MNFSELELICSQNNYSKPTFVSNPKSGTPLACAIEKFAFTAGILVGIGRTGYSRRYCYETLLEANSALLDWQADGGYHPKGNWLKVKGVMNGFSLDFTQEQLAEFDNYA